MTARERAHLRVRSLRNDEMDPAALSEIEETFVGEGALAVQFESPIVRKRRRGPRHVSDLVGVRSLFDLAVVLHSRDIMSTEQSPYDLGYAFARGILSAPAPSLAERRRASLPSREAVLRRAIRTSKTSYWSGLFADERNALAAVLSGDIAAAPQADRLGAYRSLWRAVQRLSSPIADLNDDGHPFFIDETRPYLDAIRHLARSDNASSPWQVYDQERRRRVAVPDDDVFPMVMGSQHHTERGTPVSLLDCLDERDTEHAHARNTRMRTYHLERSRVALQQHFGPVVEMATELQRAEESAADASRRQRNRDSAARPAPQAYGVSAAGAELWVRDAIRWLGASEAEATQVASDGGVDIITDHYAVSVKHYAGTVPVEEVREIFGVAIRMELKAMLWTSGDLSKAGREFADAVSMPIIQYDVHKASFTSLNGAAEAVLRGSVD